MKFPTNTVRLIQGTFGAVNFVVWGRELLTRENRDIWVDVIGSFVSIHHVYEGLVVGSAILIAAACWPSLLWIVNIPRRIRNQALRESHLGQTQKRQLLDDLDEFRDYLRTYGYNPIEDQKIYMLTKKQWMIENKLAPDWLRERDSRAWQSWIDRLIPLIVQYGVEEAIRRINNS